MNLETEQAELRQRSQEARSQRAKKNAQARGDKFTPRVRESIEITLKKIAQDPRVESKHRVDAARLYCQITGLLPTPVQEPKNDEPVTTPAPEFRGADLQPAKA